LSVLIDPYLPRSAEKIASFFGLKLGETLVWKDIGKPEGIGDIKITSEVLFTKIEDEQVESLREKFEIYFRRIAL
jgi:methionyl-tRNA synthetase